MTLAATLPDDAAFAPFGALIHGPQSPGERQIYSGWLAPVDGLAQQFHINHVAPSALPLVLRQVECHPHAAQVFLPLKASRYLAVVMPPDATGAPDRARALAVVLPGTVGVAYRPGCWHAAMTALDHAAEFAVLMWRGRADDDVFAPIAPLTLTAPLKVSA